MSTYWKRSAMILIVFMNLAITAVCAVSNYKLGYVMWCAYFLILLGLIISHKKDAVRKAMMNVILLTLVGIPISGLSIPVSLILRGFNLEAVKGNLYLFVSIAAIMYLAIRHEGFSIPETATKLSAYVAEIRTRRLRSSFAIYLTCEFVLFVALTITGTYILG